MQERFVNALILFIFFTIIFGILERLWPSISSQPKWRHGFWLDTIYWFATPMAIQILSRIFLVVVLLPIYIALGRSLDWESIGAGYGAAGSTPPLATGSHHGRSR